MHRHLSKLKNKIIEKLVPQEPEHHEPNNLFLEGAYIADGSTIHSQTIVGKGSRINGPLTVRGQVSSALVLM